MNCKVRISKNQLDYFRKRARQGSPKEIQAYLIGTVPSPNVVNVDKIVYTSKYAVQTAGEVQWFLEDYWIVKKAAEEEGKRIVGDIHSHPNWDAVMSPDDYKTHIEDGHRISGICSVLNNRTRVRFWIPESALPCAIEHE